MNELNVLSCPQWSTVNDVERASASCPEIVLTSEERAELTKPVRSKLTSVRLAQRARIVLLASQGVQVKDIAAELGIGRVQVSRWRERYAQSRLQGIERDLPRGAPPVTVDLARLVELTTQSKPEAATHWSTRTMAAQLGGSAASISLHWRKNGLKPHLLRGFKVSRVPLFVQKLEDIVGLYMSPPEHALVLCCDEKSQVQARERTQPGLPMKKSRGATMTHDYKRNGTTTLFAALNVLDGQVIGQGQQHHTHIEWLNMVERFFRDITTERLRRGVFTSVPELVTAIDKYIDHHNINPKPFIWTKSARDILQKVIRANSRLSSKQNASLH